MDKLDDIGFKVLGTRDYCKLFLWIPKVLLHSICMWPGGTYCPRYIFFVIAEISILLVIAGVAMQCIFVFRDVTDIFKELIYGAGLLLGGIKYVILFNNQKIQVIVEDIMTKFWPSDLVNIEEVKKELKTFHATVMWILVYFSISFGLDVIQDCLIVPMKFGVYPIPVYVPLINSKVFPYFEIIYLVEILAVYFLCDFVLIGFDFCFLAMCSCVVFQYKLFCNVLLTFNTPEMVEVNAKLREIDRRNGTNLKNKYKTEHDEFFARCVQHHQLLLRTVDHINSICSFVELLQVTFAILGVCSGMFILTILDNPDLSKTLFVEPVIIFVLNQLLLYCAIGNELSYEASLLPEFIFKTNWHEMEDTKHAKNFMIMLHRSQKIPEITSYGLYNLNLDFYVRVLKFTFSMYTFLTTMQQKANN